MVAAAAPRPACPAALPPARGAGGRAAAAAGPSPGVRGGVGVYQPMIAAAADRGLRVVLYGRPGYGSSTPQSGRRVADAATDVAAILDALGAGQFVTVGWSGGGPHALACARLQADRCLAAATLAAVAPYSADGLEWLAGVGAGH